MAGVPVGPNMTLSFDVFCQSGDGLQISDNRLVYYTASVTGTPDLQDAAIGFENQIYAQYKALLADTALFYGVKASVLQQRPYPYPQHSSAHQGTGTRTGDPLPSQTCGVLALNTDYSGRAYRGRIYLPFPATEDLQVDGSPSGTYVTNLNNLAAQIVGNPNITISGAGFTITMALNLYHRKTGTFTFIGAYQARPRWGTQRRRGEYGRPNTPPF